MSTPKARKLAKALEAQKRTALEKCFAAELFTTYLGHVETSIYQELNREGLIEWRNAWRLTAAGKVELERLRSL